MRSSWALHASGLPIIPLRALDQGNSIWRNPAPEWQHPKAFPSWGGVIPVQSLLQLWDWCWNLHRHLQHLLPWMRSCLKSTACRTSPATAGDYFHLSWSSCLKLLQTPAVWKSLSSHKICDAVGREWKILDVLPSMESEALNRGVYFYKCKAFLWRIILWHCKIIATKSLFKNRAMLSEKIICILCKVLIQV